ncbi:MAG: 23S rRNA (guanosine(2251)-2'-O)-methyltransferase RlmB [Bacillota bacterium]|nr:23S rRNA (guanosine(2251)-2'-O)-methyltransferase RlmB [Bacillota bacterium]
MKNQDNLNSEGIIAGRNPVLEALKSKRPPEKIFVARGEREGSIVRIISLARELKIPVQEADRVKLDHLAGISAHQGVVAYIQQKEYVEVKDILESAKEKGESPFVVIADEITDPHNLGAIIRTAEAAGAHGVIISKNRSTGITAAVVKASAGAVIHMPVAKVSNIAETIESLKKEGLWIYGADAEGTSNLFETNLSGSVGIVVGSEGEGLGRLVKERCDFLLSIPMAGKVNSLNASVAAGILMYEVVRQKNIKR